MYKDDEKWYRGNDLMEPQRKLLFQNFTDAIRKQQGEIAYLLTCEEKNSEEYDQYKNKIYELKAHGINPDKEINQLQKKLDMIAEIQGKILITLQPLFDELFDKVAEETSPGLGFNEVLRHEIWFTLLFGERDLSGPMDGPRDIYRASARSSTRQQNYEKRIQKNSEKRKKEKEKVWLPQDHQLLNKESYPKLKNTIWTYLDKVVTTYQQKFLKDVNDSNQIKGLIDHYFLFIFMQMLIQSKIVFDIKKPQSTPFIEQVINDCLSYLEEKYKVTLSISGDNIKKKIFSTIDESTQPLELIYKNCMEEDLLAREEYFNTYFFNSNGTSVDQIRREIMVKRSNNVQKMKNGWEALNPLYHISVEKKEKIQTTITLLEQHQAEDNVIEDLLKQLQENFEKAEEDRKNNVVFEEDPVIMTDLESITKLQNQYLKFHKVPVQYRKILGPVINRLNNFYQIKHILVKKAKENNIISFNQLLNSEQKTSDILYHLKNIITDKIVSKIFDQKWNQKREDKCQRIQSFCLGKQKIDVPKKKKRIKDIKDQNLLEF